MIILLIGSFILVVLLCIPDLVKANQRKKTIAVYFFLLSIGFILSIIQILDIIHTNPSDVIQSIVNFAVKR